MPHSDHGGHLAKRQKRDSQLKAVHPSSSKKKASAIFAPFRTIGLVSPTSVPFTSVPLGKTTFQITTSVGRALQTYDLKRGLNLVFVTRPETPSDITATVAWKQKVLAAWGDSSQSGTQGVWIFQRGKKVDELEIPDDLDEPIRQILVFGSWIVASAVTRIEVWKSTTLEHYTTIRTVPAAEGGNEVTGGVTNMPTFLNKIFVGRKDGWVEIWNVSTGKLIYTIVPPIKNAGSVTCLQPSTALALLAVAYSNGPLVVHDVIHDRPLIELNAGTPTTPVCAITFRSDGMGAGQDGRKDGIMATATSATGDITFWDLNGGGRVSGILRSAHNPPSRAGSVIGGGISKIEFLYGQPVIVSSGLDNSLKTWIFDKTPFSPIPRILHTRSGHAAPVNCLQFLPSDFDGAEAGNKWLLSGGSDRSLWGWSMRRDGQSTELSQGNIRKKAKKYGILSTSALAHGSTTTLEDIKAPEITCIASSLNRDGGIGALPGKQAIWTRASRKERARGVKHDAEVSRMTGWESVVTGHKGDSFARTWFWGRKRAGRWMFETGDGSSVTAVAISPCGSFALVGSAGGTMDMFNLQSGIHRLQFPSKLTPAQARQLKMQQLKQVDDVVHLQTKFASSFAPGTGRHTKAITGIIVDSTNKFVVSCSLDGKVKFWDFLTGNLMHEIDWAPMTAITGCRYHAPNDLIAFSCDDNSIRVVDVETRRTIREFLGFEKDVTDFCFSNDGRWIIAASDDCTLRVWDLPTSHLIDAIRFEHPCKAVAMSSSGEYLAACIEGQMGVGIWTNKSLFRHVPTRQISAKEIAAAVVPTVSGEGNEGLLDAAFEEDAESVDEPAVIVPDVDQLSTEMTTLSLVPKSRWQTLLHLDLIKQRNKPKEAPKLPEKAPFFLPSLSGKGSGAPKQIEDAAKNEGSEESRSRILKVEMAARQEETFTTKLLAGAARGNYDDFIDHLKSLPPSAADLELRSLSADDPEKNELLYFIRALTSRLESRKDYELTQAWMTVFLRLHFDVVTEHESILEALRVWREVQERESSRLDGLVGYCGGVVGFLRSPRT
ncbi:WD domain-containing protein [Scedosporium apiospermum]|uniref:WD domain-containing protein n=1 Tax=Pseudallescheria apiosperma TaxID=563466 RepID=A0A084G186_PSEDA|nr:WD domain-containing protein [Scedosporium apiospermum]KEZ41098.1 WD domain-containing protein [Scedosporium apiospermum]